MKMYNKRVWLNSKKSASTGSLVCYSGPSPFYDDGTKKNHKKIVFVEVGDCHQTIRLHQMYNESRKDFIKKIELMRDGLDSYLKFLNTPS